MSDKIVFIVDCPMVLGGWLLTSSLQNGVIRAMESCDGDILIYENINTVSFNGERFTAPLGDDIRLLSDSLRKLFSSERNSAAVLSVPYKLSHRSYIGISSLLNREISHQSRHRVSAYYLFPTWFSYIDAYDIYWKSIIDGFPDGERQQRFDVFCSDWLRYHVSASKIWKGLNFPDSKDDIPKFVFKENPWDMILQNNGFRAGSIRPMIMHCRISEYGDIFHHQDTDSKSLYSPWQSIVQYESKLYRIF